MSWQLFADLREIFVELVAVTDGRVCGVRALNRKDQLISGLNEALTQLPEDFKASKAELHFSSDFEKIAIREHWGTPCALLATEGFENLLEIGDQRRTELFDFLARKQAPLIPHEYSFGVTERVNHKGQIEIELDKKEIEFVASKLELAEVKSVAICFLHADKNPQHEKHLATYLQSKGFHVVCSHEFKGNERDRAYQAVTKAFTQPALNTFIDDIAKLGFQKEVIFIENSFTPLKGDVTKPRLHITEDRAGLFYKDKVAWLNTTPLNRIFIDSGGMVHVGAESLSSEPGPVCFGKGLELCLLDAMALSHELTVKEMSRFKLDLPKVARTLGPMAKQLRLSPETTAQSFFELGSQNLSLEIATLLRRFDVQQADQVLVTGWCGEAFLPQLNKIMGNRFRLAPRSSWSGLLSETKILETRELTQRGAFIFGDSK